MSTVKGRLLGAFGSWISNEGRVTAVEELGASFRLVDISCAFAAKYAPGDKVQVLLPSQHVRTYTPVHWTDAGTRLLVFLHAAESPGSQWARGLAVGSPVRFVGPQRSLTLPPEPTVLIGDETSVAVAASYALHRPQAVDVRFEIGSETNIDDALAAVGLRAVRVARRGASDPELYEGIRPESLVGLTGGAALIQQARATLRGRGVTRFKTKAYWIQGKTGLD